MRWLIVEDALRDRKGHWFEYVRAFRTGLLGLGDEVTILADKKAEPFIKKQLAAQAVLPESIWHRMSDGSGMLKRYLRLPVHAFKTWHCVRRVLKADADYDFIFVPTVSVHHLLGWVKLIKGPLQPRRARVLLYFLSMPFGLLGDGSPQWDNSPTSRLMARLFESLRPFVESGKVILGVETVPLRDALSKLVRLPVHYLPQPVEPLAAEKNSNHVGILMACYGAARHEKGSDILQSAILRFRSRHPDSKVRFAVQWVEDFTDEAGKLVTKNSDLLGDCNVEFIGRYFRDGEYFQHLAISDVMLLPYRLSSYQMRGSRVAIEAMVNGIPVIATRGTTLAGQVEEFGAGVFCEDGNVEDLGAAIRHVELRYEELRGGAIERMGAAQAHFSVKCFREKLLSLDRPQSDVSGGNRQAC